MVTGLTPPKRARSYLLVCPLPEASEDKHDGHRRLQVRADGLDVDEQLPTLAGLHQWDPQDGNDYKEQNKYPVCKRKAGSFGFQALPTGGEQIMAASEALPIGSFGMVDLN